MSSFNRELFSLTSAMPTEMVGGAKSKKSSKKHGSKKHSKKHSSKKSMKRQEGGKKHGSKKHSSKKGSKKHSSKKHSKKSSRKQSRETPKWLTEMLSVKKEVKKVHADIKDGPGLTKVVMEVIKSKGSVEDAIKHLSNMSSSELKSKLDKVNQEIAEKRASKKAARMAAQ